MMCTYIVYNNTSRVSKIQILFHEMYLLVGTGILCGKWYQVMWYYTRCYIHTTVVLCVRLAVTVNCHNNMYYTHITHIHVVLSTHM